jgi:hypothetical protein
VSSSVTPARSMRNTNSMQALLPDITHNLRISAWHTATADHRVAHAAPTC